MRTLLLLLFIPFIAASGALAQEAADPEDPYLWLEEVEGERALAWVEEWNARTSAALEADTAFVAVFEQARAIYSARERIAFPTLIGGYVYNLWQDADQPRGLWRRMPRADYIAGSETWETVLDVDALAADEGVNWVFKGANCHPPDYARCLVSLSRGGADAVEVREFDLPNATFVPDGFFVPEAKSSVTWRNADALYVGTELAEGDMTASGYPRTIRVWERGTQLAEAPVIFEGEATDVRSFASVRRMGDREVHFMMRALDFYTRATYVVEGDELERLAIPLDATPMLAAGHLVLHLKSDWSPENAPAGTVYRQGALVSIPYDDFLTGSRDFQVVVEPSERTTVRQVNSTENLLLVAVMEDVRGALHQFHLEDGSWVREVVPAPELGSISLAGTSNDDDTYFFTYQSFLQPTTLYVRRDAQATPEALRQMPAFFDAEPYVAEQHEAISADGTRVPYFVVRRADAPMDGANPTLLYAYGGFEVSMAPGYDPVRGAAWLSRGGVYVLANIRGGGEFGPGWHRAALRENRQRAYDDFIAVAEDLIERGITTSERLGIEGGSNGGLLVGAALTQRPDLFGAAVSAVPLLDMRRYHLLLAGASWMAEYGNPDDPEDWAFISRYSPYQNIQADADYPRALFYTSTRDDRVHPGHARKMVARMDELGHDVLYFENMEGGHAAAATPEQRARRIALTTTYLLQQLRDRPAGLMGTH